MYCLPIDDLCHLQAYHQVMVEVIEREVTPFYIIIGDVMLIQVGDNEFVYRRVPDGTDGTAKEVER